jgi:regulator of sirC expression with transglutaminase-like and TPR domain
VVSGFHAELQPKFYQSVTARAILLRIQNNNKNRLLRSDRVEDAIEVIDTMLLFAPKFPHLWWEKATLLARIEQIPKAILALEQFLVHGRGSDSLYEASMLLQELRQSSN